jgi:hypothetical protein
MRRILIYATNALHMRRSDIVKAAQVRPVDFDNFVKKRAPKSKSNNAPKASADPIYKTKTPSPQFQRNILRFILSNAEVANFLNSATPQIKEDFERVFQHKDSVYGFIDNDYRYLHFVESKVIDEEDAQRICRKLQGSYYVYRLSSNSNEYVRGYVQVLGYNVYSKAPRFIHWRKDKDGKERISMGTILLIQDKYVFSGFIHGSEVSPIDRPLGIKIMVFPLNSNTREIQPLGIYLSNDLDGSYEFGAMKIVKTDEPYDSNKIGIRYLLQQTLPFNPDELVLEHFHPLSEKSPTPHSIRFDFEHAATVQKLRRSPQTRLA